MHEINRLTDLQIRTNKTINQPQIDELFADVLRDIRLHGQDIDPNEINDLVEEARSVLFENQDNN